MKNIIIEIIPAIATACGISWVTLYVFTETRLSKILDGFIDNQLKKSMERYKDGLTRKVKVFDLILKKEIEGYELLLEGINKLNCQTGTICDACISKCPKDKLEKYGINDRAGDLGNNIISYKHKMFSYSAFLKPEMYNKWNEYLGFIENEYPKLLNDLSTIESIDKLEIDALIIFKNDLGKKTEKIVNIIYSYLMDISK